MMRRPTLTPILTLALLGGALPALGQGAQGAQGDLRDPLQAPASLRAPGHTASDAASAAETGAQRPQQIIVIDGRSYLVVQGRRLGVGDRWGEARILAIDAYAVTLSEGGVKRRLPLYQGVEKRLPAAGPAHKKNASEKS